MELGYVKLPLYVQGDLDQASMYCPVATVVTMNKELPP